MRMIRHALSIALVAGALALAACGKKDADQPLAFAPADSVFLAGNLEPVPQASIDGWWKGAEQMLPFYERMLDSAVADLQATDPDQLATKVAKALRDELKGKINRAGWESLGLTSQARSAVYAIGLVPVLRLELGDADAFRAFVARVEGKAGAKLPVAEVAGQQYWKVSGETGKAAVVVAIQGSHLVLTLAPATPSEALLKQLLGIDRPAQNALEAGTLEAFNSELKYLPLGSGYLDTVRLAAALTGERSAIEKEFLQALGASPADTAISAECKAEYAGLAAAVPRISFGYTTFDTKHMDMRYVVETAPTHGKALAALAADVPGLDGKGKGAFDFGFGLDLDAFAGFVNVRATALAAAPFKCAELLSLNADIAKANTELANPAVFMAGAALSGMNVSLDKIELPESAMPVVEGKLAIGSDNPQALLSMAGGYAPQVAALKLVPGAAAVPLPDGMLPPGTPAAFVALSDKALAISVGAGQEASLPAFAAAAPGKPAPLLYYGVDSRGLKVFTQAMVKASQARLDEAKAQAAAAAEGGEGEAPDAAKIAELQQAVDVFTAMQGAYLQTLERIDFALYATERGLELTYSIALK